MTDVIEISGSEEDVRTKSVSRRRTSSLSAISFTVPVSHPIRGSYGSAGGDSHGVESEVEPPPHNRRPKPGLERARMRRIVQSSSSSEGLVLGAGTRIRRVADLEVIEITDSEDEAVSSGRKTLFVRPRPPPIFDEEHDKTDDDGLLVLNEPKSARRVLPRPQIPRAARPGRPGHSGEKEDPHGLVKAFSTLSSLTTLTDSDTEDVHAAADPAASTAFPAHLPRPSANAPIATTPKTPRNAKPSYTPGRTPRTSKKALALAEQAERVAYAQSLFDELNRSVFGGGLPAETSLIWSNRLLTTAGRARWHRSKEGVHTTSIELATKILDSNERIRNTLSHEMCHLACWVINQDPKGGHGKVWKSWAAKVMRKRADIDISMRHNYEISYPYEWECENCAKTYGRFSRSIRPDEVVCGACKTGTLHPLFTVRSKKTIVDSRMAATSPRDSPRAAAAVGGTVTGVKMPGSFNHDDKELDELIHNIHRLGVEDGD